MTKYQNTKFRMYHSVANSTENFRSLWSPIRAFAAVMDRFQLLLSTISTLAGEKARKLAGVTFSKAQKRSELEEMARVVSGALVAFATAEKKPELKKAMNYAASEISAMTTENLAIFCKAVHAEAMTCRSSLASYNLPEPRIRDFEVLISEFNGLATAPRNAVADRQSMAERIKALFAEMDDLLKNELDKLVEGLKSVDPVFYEAYRVNRRIVQAATRYTQVSGLVTDKATGLPLKNVLVSVPGTGFFANTRADGTFTLRIPQTGKVQLGFEKGGYLPAAKQEVELTTGKTTEVKISLDKG